ncbi:ABC transporter substrate-binding protein [Nocardia callitridis]|uniref:ABC transporter substrate-binding protein n=2 Tax=Nocardia callitridis TaxID=648753 RepID=A0ABP9JR54_9NOCA
MIVATATLAVSCGADDGARITVGAGDSLESTVLAEIYANALARTGARTAVQRDLGERADYLAALDANRVQLVAEHTGALLSYFDADADADADAGNRTRKPKEVSDAVNGALPEGLVVSDPADGADLRARVLLTEEAATSADIHKVDDLAPQCATTAVGVLATTDSIAQPNTLARDSGCEFAATLEFPDWATLRKALLDGQIHAALLNAPTAEATTGLVVLPDDTYAIPAENVVALMRKGMLDATQSKKVNYVSGELTTDELTEMIRRVRDQHETPATVANAWLDDHAL